MGKEPHSPKTLEIEARVVDLHRVVSPCASACSRCRDVHVPHISHPSVDQGIKDKLPPCIDQPTAAEQQEEDLEVNLIAGTGTSGSLNDQPCRTKVSPAEGTELM